MTRVDFYILQDVDRGAAHRFACRLAVKAVAANTPLHLHVSDAKVAADLDDMLWNYPEHRFIPHGLQSGERHDRDPVVIGWEAPADPEGVLVNLADEIPSFFGRFDRVAEIVVGENRDAGRERYKFYRDRGFPLFHHELDDWETS
ncbi:MAG: DNA polymerase III subunit chi [Gammaproteobacteria bacterium]|nr:DNA polymerase III subunit chi [Gammaproteobacteria bacterium]